MLKLSTRNFLIALALFAVVILAASALNNRKPAPADIAAGAAQPTSVATTINTMYTPGLSPERRAFSAAEEAYSVNLWRIHDKVKTSSVQLSFAGLSYKLKELDRAGVKAKIEPQAEIYRNALHDLGLLFVPESLKELHQTYVKAVNFYADASQDMIKIAADGDEQHLLDAHGKSNQAGTLLLKVGAELWPGEFKPN